ncbi:MAG: recombinase family protein, partial [Alphaproteobacteria bacterium]|nr:recombinase family protein [Alphaproteobacteria bacterium]
MRAAIYARYSTDMQSAASIEDQARVCRERIVKEGWTPASVYADRAISGSSHLRPGYQKLLDDARRGDFDMVVAEALDRISRDQEHVAAFYKHLTFCRIKLITLAEGEISELHVGLKGTMNALFLKDLADKTRRGLRGRIEAGKSAGGLSYGYKVVKRLDASGEPIRGDREIDEYQAAVVRRIFQEFAAGRSPRAIAIDLNADAIPGPFGKTWGPSTIYGNWRRATGILNNELYVGRLVWNRQSFIKEPQTGKRQARMNPRDAWIIESAPDLALLDQETWDAVKARQARLHQALSLDKDTPRPERARRPAYLLSGLLTCGVCGSGFSKISQHHYGCSAARDRGTCDNHLTIRRDTIEDMVIGGLRDHLMDPDLFKEFAAEFARERNRLLAGAEADLHRKRDE